MASQNTTSKFNAFVEQKYIPLNQKIKIGVVVVLVAALVALFYFFILSPNLEKIKKLKDEKASLQKEVSKAQEAEKNLDKINKELEEAEKKFQEISIVLPKTKEIPALLIAISDHGTSAGLDFNSFNPGKESVTSGKDSAEPFYAEIPISIKVTGPYHNVGYFLDQVSKLERIVTVKNIKLGSPKQVEGEMILSTNCNLLTYRFLTEEERAKGKGKGKKKGKK